MILVFFSTMVSFVVFLCSSEIYSIISGIKASETKMNMSDLSVIIDPIYDNLEDIDNIFETLTKQDKNLKSYNKSQIVNADTYILSCKNKKNIIDFENQPYFISVPEKYNILYNDKNMKFTVPDGSVALSYNVADANDISIGDVIYVNYKNENIGIYSVSDIYKMPINTYNYFFVLSENDFDNLYSKSSSKEIMYDIKLLNTDSVFGFYKIIYDKLKSFGLIDFNINSASNTDDIDVGLSISVFLLLMSFFFLIIIFATIKFLILSTTKREQKECSMLRIIGINTSQIRWILIQKYIFMIIIGFLLGATLGLVVNKKLIYEYSPNLIITDSLKVIAVGVLFDAISIVFIIIYILYVVKTTFRESTLGFFENIYLDEELIENRSFFSLSKCKKVTVTLYLALSNIVKQPKKYLFFILVFSIGVMLILFSVYVEDTLKSQKYLNYNMLVDCDFSLDIENGKKSGIFLDTDKSDDWVKKLNSDFKNNNINAYISTMNQEFCEVQFNDLSFKSGYMFYGDYNTENFLYKKGGTAPILYNEIALSSHTANKYNIKCGDYVTLKYNKYNGSNCIESIERVLVTGLLDINENNRCVVICGNDFENNYVNNYSFISFKIFSEDKMGEIIKMRKLLGEDVVYDYAETISNWLGSSIYVISKTKNIIISVIIIILNLVSLLNYKILFNDEIPSVSLARIIGVSIHDIKKIYIIRFSFLIFISYLLGVLLSNTVGLFIARLAFSILGLDGFSFYIEPFKTFVFIPLILYLSSLFFIFLVLSNIKNVSLHSIDKINL